jgi:integrase
MPEKLTDQKVRDLQPPEAGHRILYDTEVKGFGVRTTANGIKSFILNYRVARRERRYTIGQFPVWKVRAARKEAADKKRDIDRGIDPLTEREEARAALTVSDLVDRYLAEHAAVKKKPRSSDEDRRNTRLHVTPNIGKLPVAAVTRDDIARLHNAMRDSPIAANRVLALLSKMFSLAEIWALRPVNSNPCRGIDRFKERHRDRLVTPEELGRLGDALAAHKGYWAGPAAIRLMALTGMRKSEVLTLRWSDVDMSLGWARLADSKTGPKTIPLGMPVLSLLAGLPRVEGNPYVLPAARLRRRAGEAVVPDPASGAGHFIQVQSTWEQVTKAAGITDLRLHDLRHGFASVGAMGGDSLFIVGKLLGHRDSQTTQRYSHLAADPLRAVADRISNNVAAALAGKNAEE